LTSKDPPTEPGAAGEEPPDRTDSRALVERAIEVLRRSKAVRIESSETHQHSRELRDRYVQARTRHGDRTTRLEALDLLEAAAIARRHEDREARQHKLAAAYAQVGPERYRQVFESTNDGLAILEVLGNPQGVGRDAVVIECNAAFGHLVGHPSCTGKLLSTVVPDAVPEWLRQLDRVRHTGDPASFEAAVAGEERWLRISLSRVDFAHTPRVALVVSDITPRKRAEAALAASEMRLRLIVENAREYAIFAMDPSRRIESWNSGAQAILGWTEAEALGQSADIIFTPEDRAARVPEREAATAIATGRASDERWHIRKDRSRFYGSGVMTAMRDDAGAVIGLLKIFRDQTAELLAKQALEQARADAEAATQAKDHFLAVLSHELRTPLTPVLLATELLQDRDDLPPDVAETVAMIRRNVALEAHFVDDLLDVTRIVRGKVALARGPLDVHEVLAAAVDIVRGDVDAKRQRLSVAFAAVRHRVDGDRAKLQQVFWNLLKNASKFTPIDGAIAVRTLDDAGAVAIEVVDEGIGIDASRLGAIFDPFVQADATIAREFGGLGLGLAIARATVEAHAGTLVAASDGPGRGATFTVRLPLAP
jgi:PAS domain S-box-containing protein